MVHELVYKSLLHHARLFAPSGVSVVEGESYGVRTQNSAIQYPSITVTIADVETAAIELGSDSLRFEVVYTIAAKSRMQRDALKDIIYSGITLQPIPLYDAFEGAVPASGAVRYRDAQVGDYIKTTDMPMFETGREKLFWTAVIFTDYVVT